MTKANWRRKTLARPEFATINLSQLSCLCFGEAMAIYGRRAFCWRCWRFAHCLENLVVKSQSSEDCLACGTDPSGPLTLRFCFSKNNNNVGWFSSQNTQIFCYFQFKKNQMFQDNSNQTKCLVLYRSSFSLVLYLLTPYRWEEEV